ncbi:HAD family hydrolase [Patescibacteria group bacterium]
MIKVIIFDLGGVYFSVDYKNLQNNLAKKFPEIPKSKINQIINGKIGKDYRLGKYTKQEFWKKVKKITGSSFDIKKFSETWHSSYCLNKDVKQLALKLRKNYKVCALSGNIRERVKFLDQKYSFKKDFDLIVYSYIAGVNKLHPRIYKVILNRLGLKGEECVFIDDTKERLKPAKKLGMKTIHFTNTSALKRELKKLNIF